jgi:hypothetical protein
MPIFVRFVRLPLTGVPDEEWIIQNFRERALSALC